MVPFADVFAEKKVEFPAFSRSYSEEKQRNILDPKDSLNPLYMSPTVLHTQGGDREGDEAH